MRAVVSTSTLSRTSVLNNIIENWRELSAMTALIACITGLFASIVGGLPSWNKVFYGGLAIFSGISWKMSHDYKKYSLLAENTRSLRKSDSSLQKAQKTLQESFDQSQNLLSEKQRLITTLQTELLQLRQDRSLTEGTIRKLHEENTTLKNMCTILKQHEQEQRDHHTSLEKIVNDNTRLYEQWKESQQDTHSELTLEHVGQLIAQLKENHDHLNRKLNEPKLHSQ